MQKLKGLKHDFLLHSHGRARMHIKRSVHKKSGTTDNLFVLIRGPKQLVHVLSLLINPLTLTLTQLWLKGQDFEKTSLTENIPQTLHSNEFVEFLSKTF